MAASDWWIQACTINFLIKSANSKEFAKFLTLPLYLQLISCFENLANYRNTRISNRNKRATCLEINDTFLAS